MRPLTIRLLALAALVLCLNARSFAASGTATLIGTDTTTLGNWQGMYGTVGYYIPNGPSVIPSDGSSFSPGGASTYTWGVNVPSPNALKTGASTDIASCWYNNLGTSSPSLTFDVIIPAGQTQTVALYLMDYDHYGRSESVSVTDASNDTPPLQGPNALSGANFVNGEYLVWSISGEVHINITLVGGINAVASGIFFGENGLMPPPVATGAYLFQKTNGSLGAGGYATLTFTLPAGTYIVQFTANAFSNTTVAPGTLNQIEITDQEGNLPITTPDEYWNSIAASGGTVTFPPYVVTLTVSPASTTLYKIVLDNYGVAVGYSLRVVATPVSGLSVQSFGVGTP